MIGPFNFAMCYIYMSAYNAAYIFWIILPNYIKCQKYIRLLNNLQLLFPLGNVIQSKFHYYQTCYQFRFVKQITYSFLSILLFDWIAFRMILLAAWWEPLVAFKSGIIHKDAPYGVPEISRLCLSISYLIIALLIGGKHSNRLTCNSCVD